LISVAALSGAQSHGLAGRVMDLCMHGSEYFSAVFDLYRGTTLLLFMSKKNFSRF